MEVCEPDTLGHTDRRLAFCAPNKRPIEAFRKQSSGEATESGATMQYRDGVQGEYCPGTYAGTVPARLRIQGVVRVSIGPDHKGLHRTGWL